MRDWLADLIKLNEELYSSDEYKETVSKLISLAENSFMLSDEFIDALYDEIKMIVEDMETNTVLQTRKTVKDIYINDQKVKSIEMRQQERVWNME